MTKQEISRILAQKADISAKESERMVDLMVNILADSLADGHSIYLRGLATFAVNSSRPRKARNISKGTSLVIPARRVVKFKLSKTLKLRMNDDENHNPYRARTGQSF